ncbi:hypothetical protein F7Q96_02010 [Cupriavidus gilardii]|nr:hypothetical protein F7Q96_02010 [Cupriavidus gilardii]
MRFPGTRSTSWSAINRQDSNQTFKAGLHQAGVCPGNRRRQADRRSAGIKGYFGAYLRDSDGNKVQVVHRGDLPTISG